MIEQAVTFPSAGLKLSGVVHVPRGLKPSERRGAFLVLHGFGSNKTSSNTMAPTKVLSDLGYVVLRFDMRGCGDSEGEFGRVICLEQVEDTRSALTFLAQHPAVDPQRIGLIGSSFGGAVAIYTGGVDERVAAIISNGGWGDGERKFRGQHKSPEAWARFTKMLKEGREHRARTGKSLMCRATRSCRSRRICAAISPATRSSRSRRRPRRACSTSAPTTWSAASRRDRSCSCMPPTIR